MTARSPMVARNARESGPAAASDSSWGSVMPVFDDFDEVRASRSGRVVWLVTLFLAAFFAWAWFFEIDEVSSGMGKVIPTSREQRIQSLEGGILTVLRVREGEIVEKGAVLAQLDPTPGESNVQ